MLQNQIVTYFLRQAISYQIDNGQPPPIPRKSQVAPGPFETNKSLGFCPILPHTLLWGPDDVYTHFPREPSFPLPE